MAEADELIARVSLDPTEFTRGAKQVEKDALGVEIRTEKTSKSMSESFKKTFDGIGSGFAKAFKIASIAGFVVAAIRSSETLSQVWQGAFNVLGTAVDSVLKQFGITAERVKKFWAELAIGVEIAIQAIRNGIVALFTLNLGRLTDGFDKLAQKARDLEAGIDRVARNAEVAKVGMDGLRFIMDQTGMSASDAAAFFNEQGLALEQVNALIATGAQQQILLAQLTDDEASAVVRLIGQLRTMNEERKFQQEAVPQKLFPTVDDDIVVAENFANRFGEAMQNAGSHAGSFAQSWKEKLNLAKQFTTQFVSGGANAFAQFFSNLVTGAKNSGDKLVAAMLGTIGQIMVQWGTYFLLTGIGMLFIPGMQGNAVGAIAAGLALIAAGGVVQGIASNIGGEGASRTGGFGADGGFGASGGGGELLGGEEGVVQQQRGPNIVFNITGADLVPADEWDRLMRGVIAPALRRTQEEEGILITPQTT